MKILCVIDSLGSGGAQRQLVELAKGFSENGHEVSFLIYHNNLFFKPELEKVKISINLITESNYLKRYIKIRSFIRNYQPQVILSFLTGANIAATFASIPTKNWILIVGERSANPFIIKSPLLRFTKLLHIFADFVVSNSIANLNLIRKANPFLKKRNLKVIYNIVNLPRTPKSTRSDSNKITIVVAASYRPVKNLDGLIKAVNQLKPYYRNSIEIQWYGNPEDKDYAIDMKKMVNDLGLTEIIKLREAEYNIYQRYMEADYVALFSHYEGFPNSICEAMGIGRPVIVSMVSDIPVLIKDGVNGFTCLPDKTETITKALVQAIDCPLEKRLEMANRNRSIALNTFNKKVILDQYLKLFE